MRHEGLPDLSAVEVVCDRACDLVREMLKGPVERWNKGDQSPVTAIDMAVDAFLHRELRPLMPDAAWLSEETKDRSDRLSRSWVWVVDPIDGTRSLIAGRPEFCVSIGLVRTGQGPVLGVIGNPSTGERWSGELGGGAYDRQGQRLRVRATCDPDQVDLVVSRSDAHVGLWDDADPKRTFRRIGSLAYKMALVASGLCDGHATPTPRSEWDAAAGQVLIGEAGGRSADLHSLPLRFNQPRPQFDGFVVASTAAWPEVVALARSSHLRWQEVLRVSTR